MDDSTNAVETMLAQWNEVPTETKDALNEPSDDLAEENLDSEDSDSEDLVEDEGTDDEQVETLDDEPKDEDEGAEDNSEGEDEDPQEILTVTVKVNGEDKEVSVDELKRLYGQEASLTQKSQKVADERKAFEVKEQTYEATLERLIGNSKANYEQYANIDWMVAQKQLTDEEFSVLRSEATKAQKEFQSVTQEVGVYLKEKETTLATQHNERAVKAHEVLNESNIGWSKDKYTALVAYAIANGVPEETARSYVDAPIFLILDKAMKAESAQTLVAKKKSKTPQKVVRSKEKPKVNSKEQSFQSASTRLNKSGSEDDAVALLLEKWQ